MFQPRLEVRHLRMLQVMSRTGNITHAAVALCLTQSALSHQNPRGGATARPQALRPWQQADANDAGRASCD
jgi:hypothetical protein